MSLQLHEGAGNWFVLAVQGLLLLLLDVSGLPHGFALGLMAAGAVGLLGWFGASRRVHAMENTPTSKVASAAQGYVELSGQAEPWPGPPLMEPVTATICVWYRVATHANTGSGWVLERTTTSTLPVRLRDETGVCLLRLEGAELRLVREERVRESMTREHRIQRIEIGDTLHALGQFATLDSSAQGGPQAALAERLRSQDFPAHVMCAPADGRPYLISDRPGQRLMSTYRKWAQRHAMIAFFGLAAAVLMLVSAL
jgi:hypothetical protein